MEERKEYDYEQDMKELVEKVDFIEGTEEEKRLFLETFLRSLVFC